MDNSNKFKLSVALLGLSAIFKTMENTTEPSVVHTSQKKPDFSFVRNAEPERYLPPTLAGDERVGVRESTRYLADVPQDFVDTYISAVYKIQEVAEHPTECQQEFRLSQKSLDRVTTASNIPNLMRSVLTLDNIRKVYRQQINKPKEIKSWRQNFKEWRKPKKEVVIPITEPSEDITPQFMDKFLKRLEEIEDADDTEIYKEIFARDEIEAKNARDWYSSPECRRCNTIVFVHKGACWAEDYRDKTKEEWITKYGRPLPKQEKLPPYETICETPISFVIEYLRALKDVGYVGKTLLKAITIHETIPIYRKWQIQISSPPALS